MDDSVPIHANGFAEEVEPDAYGPINVFLCSEGLRDALCALSDKRAWYLELFEQSHQPTRCFWSRNIPGSKSEKISAIECAVFALLTTLGL